MQPWLQLEGKVAFVTGSSRGIGWAIARLFACAGASVVLNGRSDADLLEQRTEELQSVSKNGSAFASYCFDVGDTQQVKECYRAIFGRFRRLDILVNNAGVMKGGVIGMISESDVRETFAINSIPVILNTQEAVRLMMRGKSGSIINITSIMGTQGGEGFAAYSASKASIIGLTIAAARELASRNIRVNAVAPGLVRTAMTEAIPAEQFERAVQKIKMRRPAEPDDIAKAVLFLASDLSAYVTGQVIGVDGGMHL